MIVKLELKLEKRLSLSFTPTLYYTISADKNIHTWQ